MSNRKLILASQSPRRLEILRNHGWLPEARPVDIDENLPDELNFRDAVMFLSFKKATVASSNYLRSVTDRSKPSPIILASDTVVFHNRILGKPKNADEAYEMLSGYSGTVHQVATGITLLSPGNMTARVSCNVTKVYCKKFTDNDIIEYIESGEPFGKAGAYAIQGGFRKHIDHIEGDYENVVGLPYKLFKSEWDEICKTLDSANR